MRLTKYDKVLQKLLSYFWLLILEAEDLTRFSTSQFASPRRGTGTFYHARCVLIPSCTNQTLNSNNNGAICFRFQRQSRPRVLAKVGRAGLLAAQVDIQGVPKTHFQNAVGATVHWLNYKKPAPLVSKKLIFWSFLTKTKPDQAFPSHVHGKIWLHSTQCWVMIFFY